MLAPIVNVRTDKDSTGAHPSPWWRHLTNDKPVEVASITRSMKTTSRNDYQYRGCGLSGNTRFGSGAQNNSTLNAGNFTNFIIVSRYMVSVKVRRVMEDVN